MLFAEAYSAGIVLVLTDAHEHGRKLVVKKGIKQERVYVSHVSVMIIASKVT